MLKCYYTHADKQFLYNKDGDGNPSYRKSVCFPLTLNFNTY